MSGTDLALKLNRMRYLGAHGWRVAEDGRLIGCGKIDGCGYNVTISAEVAEAVVARILDGREPPRLAVEAPKPPSCLLDDLADELQEARRYCGNNPDHVRVRLKAIVPRLEVMENECDRRRLAANLLVAHQFVGVDRELAEGYIYGAASEVRAAADKARKAERKNNGS